MGKAPAEMWFKSLEPTQEPGGTSLYSQLKEGRARESLKQLTWQIIQNSKFLGQGELLP